MTYPLSENILKTSKPGRGIKESSLPPVDMPPTQHTRVKVPEMAESSEKTLREQLKDAQDSLLRQYDVRIQEYRERIGTEEAWRKDMTTELTSLRVLLQEFQQERIRHYQMHLSELQNELLRRRSVHREKSYRCGRCGFAPCGATSSTTEEDSFDDDDSELDEEDLTPLLSKPAQERVDSLE